MLVPQAPSAGESPRRPIPFWRLAGGAFLHFCVPAYLTAALLDALLAASRPGLMLRTVIAFTPRFILIYLACALVVTAGAAVVDRRLGRRTARREAIPARRSEAALAAALARCRGLFGAVADRSLSELAAARWDHADPRQQALTRDLDEATATAAAALAVAPADRQAAIAMLAAETLGRIVAAQADLARSQARGAEQQVKAIARYVQIRYDPADFARGPD